jgi:hypothetical protein
MGAILPSALLVVTTALPPQASLLDRAVPFEPGWRITPTARFDITFTAIASTDLDRLAGMAERAYGRLAAEFSHELSLRPLLVVYQTRAELDRAIADRTYPGNREHLLWPLDTPAPDAEGRFRHELAHVFTFDIVPPPPGGAFPRWLHEGVAELARGEWSESDVAFVRDWIRRDAVPAFAAIDAERAGDDRTPTVLGHLAVDFLVQRAGASSVRQLLAALRQDPPRASALYLAATGLSAADFDREFSRYVRARFAA